MRRDRKSSQFELFSPLVAKSLWRRTDSALKVGQAKTRGMAAADCQYLVAAHQVKVVRLLVLARCGIWSAPLKLPAVGEMLPIRDTSAHVSQKCDADGGNRLRGHFALNIPPRQRGCFPPPHSQQTDDTNWLACFVSR